MSTREETTRWSMYRVVGLLALLLGLFGVAVGISRDLIEVTGMAALLAVFGLWLMKRKESAA